MNHLFAAGLVLMLFAFPHGDASAQSPDTETGVPTASAGERNAPTMSAKLVDADQKAKKKSATVSVNVHGLKIVDPASVNEKAAKGQGHLHYRVDDGPVIATTATKLSFHGLSSGTHTITVTLAGNDHAPLGPSETLNVTVP